jgi:hypothetical protein
MMPVNSWVFFALTALFSTYNGVHCGVKNALPAQKTLKIASTHKCQQNLANL